MTFDEIMTGITAGLKGDPQKDGEYLRSQMEIYKDHEYGKEICRACGRLLYEILPNDRKAELDQIISDYKLGIEAVLDEVKFCCYKKILKKPLL